MYVCIYGQTYTMGILECVNDEHAGIIPRAVSQIFDYVRNYQLDGEEQAYMSGSHRFYYVCMFRSSRIPVLAFYMYVCTYVL